MAEDNKIIDLLYRQLNNWQRSTNDDDSEPQHFWLQEASDGHQLLKK